jgi:formyltetrahydrofolate synthetase
LINSFSDETKDVTAIYGKPDRNYKDEDDNVIFAYNSLKIRLTFYKEEEFKLGYMVASNPKLELFGNKVVNRKSVKLKEVATKGVANFTQEEFDTLKITLMKTIDYLSNRV